MSEDTCTGPCEACRPTRMKRIRIWQAQETYRTTVVYALSAKEASELIDSGAHEYDWEHEQGDWETVEACAEGYLDE